MKMHTFPICYCFINEFYYPLWYNIHHMLIVNSYSFKSPPPHITLWFLVVITWPPHEITHEIYHRCQICLGSLVAIFISCHVFVDQICK